MENKVLKSYDSFYSKEWDSIALLVALEICPKAYENSR